MLGELDGSSAPNELAAIKIATGGVWATTNGSPFR